MLPPLSWASNSEAVMGPTTAPSARTSRSSSFHSVHASHSNAARKQDERARCGGVSCSGKAFVSQCAPEAPIGVTFRQKVVRYQQTAQSVLNRARIAVRRRAVHVSEWVGERGDVLRLRKCHDAHSTTERGAAGHFQGDGARGLGSPPLVSLRTDARVRSSMRLRTTEWDAARRPWQV